MTDADTLTPPKRVGTNDPGAKDLAESSESEDHYSDAQSAPQSPIPKTRVERVDTEPSYGEVPGTEEYRKREGDAEPDEIAIIQDLDATNTDADASTAAGQPIPKTVVEESSGTVGAHSEEFLEKRKADAEADEVVKAEDQGGRNTDSPVLSGAALPEDEDKDVPPVPEVKAAESENVTQHEDDAQTTPVAEMEVAPRDEDTQPISDAKVEDTDEDAPQEEDTRHIPDVQVEDTEEDVAKPDQEHIIPAQATLGTAAETAEYDEDEDGDEGFGDDFDDFEEGGDDADFDDFEDGFQQAEPEAPAPAPAAPPVMPPSTLPYAVPDFEGLDSEEIFSVANPYLNSLFPPEELDLPTLPPLSKENTLFFTPRSASLWSQLVAPPPLAPPDWIRSRIRRLFLVSLGVPVDLDEILPASKQKKLVLPSLHRRNSRGSRRTSTDSRSVSRLRQTEANASSTSIDSKGNAKPPGTSSRKRGPPPAPELDLVAVRQLATTTEQALDGMTDDELNAHIKRLKEMEDTAKLVLEHWKKKTDEKIGDREAFEGVIENLVKHARNSRK